MKINVVIADDEELFRVGMVHILSRDPAIEVIYQASNGSELLEYLNGNLSRQKVPRSIDFVTELPRLPTGKLYKRVLRDKYWGEGKSRIIQE